MNGENLSYQDHLDKSSPPWKGNFYQLISLWEIMGTLQAYAHDMANFLSRLVAFMNHFEGSDIPLDDPIRELTYGWISSVIPQAKELGLNLSVIGIYRAQRAIKHDPAPEVAITLDDVCSRIVDELKSVKFLHIKSEMEEYYEERQLFTEDLFGPNITNKLPDEVVEDIEEAGKCFALNRYSACVFHLMRVIEHTVQRFGKKLKVKFKKSLKDESWYNILKAINEVIKIMPESTARQKEKKDKYATISLHLNNVRIAWRNKTMHPKATYTEKQAKSVLDSVRLFLGELAEIL